MTQNVSETDSTTPVPGQVPGMSGKKLTAVVIVGLVIIGMGLSYTLWTYSRIDAAREDVQVAWREVVQQLASRYHRIETAVARGVDDEQIAMEWGEQFRLAIDHYRTTAQFDEQYLAAERVESLLVGEPVAHIDLKPENALDEALDEALDSLDAQLKQRSDWLSSPGGKFLDIFLEFPELPEFVLSK